MNENMNAPLADEEDGIPADEHDQLFNKLGGGQKMGAMTLSQVINGPSQRVNEQKLPMKRDQV